MQLRQVLESHTIEAKFAAGEADFYKDGVSLFSGNV
jgi:hypothetical protein